MTEKQAEIIVALANCDMKISRVSEKYYFHRNTIVHHIENIKKKTGLDPQNFFDLCELYPIAKDLLEGHIDVDMGDRQVCIAKKISVKYFEPDLEPISKISVGDWIDLRSAETVVLKAGEYYLFRLGVGMILPAGYEAWVVPRSSTPSKFGIVCANSIGIIDNSYSGDNDEWRFPAIAIRDTEIQKGDRIAQFRIVKNQPRSIIDTVDKLKEESRGGIGSTGTR